MFLGSGFMRYFAEVSFVENYLCLQIEWIDEKYKAFDFISYELDRIPAWGRVSLLSYDSSE
jgi:hypothetical protein